MISNESNLRNASAFTLAEVLIALALTAALLGGILSVLTSVMTSSRRCEELSATQKVGHAIVNLIQRDLEAIYLPANARASDNERVYFLVENGGPLDKINFITAVQSLPDLESGKRGPISEVGYHWMDNRDSGEDLYYLFRREQLYTDDNEPLAGGVFLEVYDRLTKFNITCYDGEEWVEEWDWSQTEKKLPMAVRFEIGLSVDRKKAARHLTDAELDRIEKQSTFITIINLPLGEPLNPAEEGK